MRYHILGREFERIAGTDSVRDLQHGRVTDLAQWSYDHDLTDAQILALTIGAILKGIL
jgi:hypothetical protein